MKNVLKLFSFFIGLYLSITAFANHPTMDVYGTNEKTAAKLIHQFGPEIEAYAQWHAAEYRLKPECQPENQAKTKQKIIEKIKNSGDFAYADISTITYPDLKEFITIDVVEKKDKKRIAYLAQFNAKNFNAKIKKSKELDILINEWLSYEKVGEELFYKKAIHFTKNCTIFINLME